MNKRQILEKLNQYIKHNQLSVEDIVAMEVKNPAPLREATPFVDTAFHIQEERVDDSLGTHERVAASKTHYKKRAKKLKVSTPLQGYIDSKKEPSFQDTLFMLIVKGI